MQNRLKLLFPIGAVGIVLLSALTASAPPLRAELPPLIPRSIILEESERGNPRLSPDGKMIAYCAPYDGVANIWVQTAGKDDDRVVTRDTQDGIFYCQWQADGQHVLYFQDQSGDENSHLFQTRLDTGATRDLTPVSGAKAMGLIQEAGQPDTLLIHMNARDRRLFDLYRLELTSGALKLDTENPGDVSRFYADHRLRVRAAFANKPDNSAEIRVRDSAGDPWRTLIAWGGDEMNSDNTGFAGFTADDDKIWVITSLGANAERLVEVDLRTGGMDVVSADPLFDVTGLLINPVRNTLEAVRYERERMAWVFLDDSIRGDFALLAGIGEGDVSIRSRDSSDTGWLVRFSAPNRPTAYYHFDRDAKTITFLFSEDPALEAESLAMKDAIDFVATDGMTIYGYVTLPVGVEPRDLPLVVYVHGGPWTRDSWELDFPAQWLANRGYAVLQVNFRGSTGYGKAYQNAGNLEWGGKAVQDLVDGKNWAVMQGIADPRRVAIMGGSYGGYATLAAMTFWPGEFACGVAMNAMSDANLFMNSMPPKWTVARGRFEARMGKDPEFLTRISPLQKANQVMSPLFIIHNANDVRVRQEHADLMVAALRALGKDATYMVLPDAGHTGGAGSSNLMRRWAAIETFLGKHLGGRIEAPNNAEKWEPLLR